MVENKCDIIRHPKATLDMDIFKDEPDRLKEELENIHMLSRMEAIQSKNEDLVNESYNLTILDDVFKSFLETNKCRRRNHTFQEILDLNRKVSFSYVHDEITYRADVYTREDPEGIWVNIKLTNNGFQYKPHLGKTYWRHKTHNWIPIAREGPLKFFDCMNQIISKTEYPEHKFHYNHVEQRVDIMFYNRNPDGLNIEINYENFPPWEELQIERVPRT